MEASIMASWIHPGNSPFGCYARLKVMAPWDLHEMYLSLDVNDILGYPNWYNTNYITNVPKFYGNPSSTIILLHSEIHQICFKDKFGSWGFSHGVINSLYWDGSMWMG